MLGLKVCVQLKEKCGNTFWIGFVKPREPDPKISADCGPMLSVPLSHLNSVKRRSLSRRFQSRRSEPSSPWNRLSLVCCLYSVSALFSKGEVRSKVPAWSASGVEQLV